MLDRLQGAVRQAARMLDMPEAMISVREGGAWSAVASHGEVTACSPDWIHDRAAARKEPLIAESPAPDTGSPSSAPQQSGGICFYAAVPLLRTDGTCAGVLCVGSEEPRELSDDEVQALLDIANLAASELERGHMASVLSSKQWALELLTESLTEVVWVTELTTPKVTYVSDRAQEVYGRPLQDFYQNPDLWLEAVHPADRERVERESKSLFDAQQVELEYRIVRPDGTVRHLRDRKHVIYDDQGNPTGMGGTAIDITEQRLIAEELHRSEEQFRRIFEESPMGIALVDQAGRIKEANDVFTEILGCDREWLVGRSYEAITHPDDRSISRKETEALYDGEIQRFQLDKRYIRRDGETVWGHLTCSIVRFCENEQFIIAMVQDVTEQRKTQQKLRKTQNTLNRAVNAAGMRVWDIDLCDDTVRVLVEGNWFQDMLPYSDRHPIEEALGSIHPEDRPAVEDALHEALHEAGSYHVEYRALAQDGSMYWIESWGEVHAASEHRSAHVSGLSMNITPRKNSEEELRQAKRAAEEASRAKSELLMSVGHEVRTPLTAIRGFVDILEEEIEEEKREFVSLLQASVRRLDRMLVSLLDFSQLQQPATLLELDEVDLAAKLEETAAVYQIPAEEKGLSLDVNISLPTMPVRAHSEALDRVLDNLVSNALKFTGEGGVMLTAEQVDDEVVLKVSDTGIGISEDFRPVIYEPFTQESRGVQRRYGGIGLGLAVTHRLVEKMGGDISVESTRGEGTTFRITLEAAA